MKKMAKILLGLIIIVGGVYFGVSLATDKKVDEDMELSQQFEIESNRFAQFANMTDTEKVIGDLIGEGNNLTLNFSALTQERVDRLREINDMLEESFAEAENNVVAEFADLTTRLEALEKADISKLTEEKKTEFTEKLSEGKMIIMNRMAVNEDKVEQLRKVVEALEALLP